MVVSEELEGSSDVFGDATGIGTKPLAKW